ncbi:MAG: pyridoxal phosphate-dependent aminotransferase family protein [Saprospiraceae bacterium]|nr:pyridoxal phosphate-dependent aminotransferase family protein [Saprospiraceae bacterium]
MEINKNFDAYLKTQLDEKKSKGLLRQLIAVDNKIDFCSNDYLGFASNKALIDLDNKNANKDANKNLKIGSTGSRLITGNSELAEETEAIIAQFHKAEAALIYSSGYSANVGLFSCLVGKEDTIISDEYIHASIIDGIRLNKANRIWFKHNDLEDLETKLKLAHNKIIVVIESIYSMDGDEAPLSKIADLCEKYGALLIVDEAHSTGIYGENGEGLVCHYGLENRVYARIHTFGKALGFHGASIVGSAILRHYLINYSRAFIYTTGIPPSYYLQIQATYNYLPKGNKMQLFELINYFRIKCQTLKNSSLIESYSPIQALIIGDNFKAKVIEKQLLNEGYFVKAILSPTVAIGTERLRISIHSFNTKTEIDGLIKAIELCLTD